MVRRSSGSVDVYAWCVGDVREMLQAHTAAYPDHQVTTVWMYMSSNSDMSGTPSPPYRDLWGDPAELASWSEEAWTSLLQAVPTTWGSEVLHIRVPPTAPLRGLLACLPHPHLTQGRDIVVQYGTAGLGVVESCVYTCQQAGLTIQLYKTAILVPEGEQDSLRARRDRLFEAKDGEGERMMIRPWWRTPTGEEYADYQIEEYLFRLEGAEDADHQQTLTNSC